MINHLIFHANIHIQDTHMHTRIKHTHAQKVSFFPGQFLLLNQKELTIKPPFNSPSSHHYGSRQKTTTITSHLNMVQDEHNSAQTSAEDIRGL